jgi:hypothetical protein
MRRTALRLTAALALAVSALPAGAQNAPAQPPHAWLFGTWTGGLFPAPSGLSAEACLGQPVVIFTRDVVLRATLTDLTYVQRVIQTVRTSPQGADFQFNPAPPPAPDSEGLLGIAGPAPDTGFGCASTDVLHVERHGNNEISFPGCADFPNPLVRCPG